MKEKTKKTAYDDDLEEVRKWAQNNNYNLIITA